MPLLKDRVEAAHLLARKIERIADSDVVVLTMVDSSAELGSHLSDLLGAKPVPIFIQKVFHPFWGNYEIGAVSASGRIILSHADTVYLDTVWLKGAINDALVDIRAKRDLLSRFEEGKHEGKLIVITDDQTQTGMGVMLAISELAKQYHDSVTVAVPYLPKNTHRVIQGRVRQVVTLGTAEDPDMPIYEQGGIDNFSRLIELFAKRYYNKSGD